MNIPLPAFGSWTPERLYIRGEMRSALTFDTDTALSVRISFVCSGTGSV